MMPSREAAEFADFCGESFSIPEFERDIWKEPDNALMEAVNYHAVSAMILTQGLHWQGQAYQEKMERDLIAKTEQIRALEKVLEMAKKKTEEEETSRKAAEAAAAKVKNDFHTDRKRKSNEN